MYKSAIETEISVKGLVTVEMDGRCENVTVYVHEATDCTITAEAQITGSPEDFIELVAPILKAIGYSLTKDQRVV